MNLTPINYDLIFLAIAAISTIWGLVRGGVTEALSLSTWFITFYIMRHWNQHLGQFIPSSISNSFIKSVIVFLVIFIVVAIVMALIRKLFANVIAAVGLGGLNIFLGGLFGLTRGILICAIFIIAVAMLNLDNENNWGKSRLYPELSPVVQWIIKTIPDIIKLTYSKAGL